MAVVCVQFEENHNERKSFQKGEKSRGEGETTKAFRQTPQKSNCYVALQYNSVIECDIVSIVLFSHTLLMYTLQTQQVSSFRHRLVASANALFLRYTRDPKGSVHK